MTQQEVMKTFMQSLDETEMSGRSALDEAIKKSSDFGSYQEVVTKFRSDWEAAGNWHTFLVKYCGIILDNKDTGAITGSDAGGASAKGAEDIIPIEGDAVYPEGTSFTVDGLTIYGIPPKDELTADQRYVVQGLYSWWLKGALDLIKESYGLTFTEENTTNTRLKLKFYEDSDSGTLTYVSFNSLNGTRKEFESHVLAVNMAQFKNISWSDNHGSMSNSISLDRILVHELVHSIMASNVNYLADLPGAIIEGATAEIIHGIDDMRYQEIISYAKDIDTVISSLSTEMMLGNAVYAVYTSGYIFMRYFLKQAADTAFDYDTYKKKISVAAETFATNYWDDVKIVGSNGADTITNSGEKVSINAKGGANTIKNYSDKVTIKAGSGNDNIYNDGSNVKITLGAGANTIDNAGASVALKAGLGNDSINNEAASFDASIWGGKGNDTIDNHGTDIFIMGEHGKDFVNNYGVSAFVNGGAGDDDFKNSGAMSTLYGGAGNDSMENTSANSTLYGDDGNDYLENTGNESAIYGGAGTDKIKNDSELSMLYGGAGKDSLTNYGDGNYIFGGAGNDSIYNSGAWTELDGGGGKDYFNNEGTAVYISGGAGNDKIFNYGDNVSIEGGAGNDSIVNDGGKHIFYQFGEDSGTDTVVGFNANDTIKITSGGYSAAEIGDDVIVSVGDGSLLLKDAAGKEINFIDAAGLSAIWFIEENNFAADNISLLVENDLNSIALNEIIRPALSLPVDRRFWNDYNDIACANER